MSESKRLDELEAKSAELTSQLEHIRKTEQKKFVVRLPREVIARAPEQYGPNDCARLASELQLRWNLNVELFGPPEQEV
jgi:hypothetical protein